MTDGPEIAALLREIADYLTLEGERFRARAYRRAAQSLEGVHDVWPLLEANRLTELVGVGRSLGSLIEEISERGTAGLLERLRSRWPKVLAEVAALPRIGAEKARRLEEAFAPRSLEEIATLCEAGRVRKVPGFSRISEARLLDAIRHRGERTSLLLLDAARELSETLARSMRRLPATRVVVCGPARCWLEVTDRIALAIETPSPDALLDHARAHSMIASFELVRPELALARLTNGVACELHFGAPGRFGTTLVRATGSAAHLERLARHAASRGTTIEAVLAADEPAFYAALGLPWLPPEVRDGTDEIEAALCGDDFTDLVELGDLQGAVHCHTTYSDGKSSIAEMARAAGTRGLSYITITDHSRSAGYAGGLSIERLREQRDEIERVQRETEVRILPGTESDILADGSLDYPREVLESLDLVIASIHKRHRLDEDGMTRRLVSALRQPVFKIWGHALGRILLHREPIACRFDEVLDAIAESPVAIEINGDPRRLDLEPSLARQARERGARFVLSCDAHSTRQIDNLAAAVGMARRARIRKREVLNALPVDDFREAVRVSRSSNRAPRTVVGMATSKQKVAARKA